MVSEYYGLNGEDKPKRHTLGHRMSATQNVLQVATPFSTGTGLYLPGHDLVVTNEHVVRDNATVVVGGEGIDEQLAEVVYLDAYYDLAFLRPAAPFDLPPLRWAETDPPVDSPVVAFGQQFGRPLSTSRGRVLELDYEHHGIPFILHDAWQRSAQSGGPLFAKTGELVGINMYDIQEGKGRALSLPARFVRDCLDRFSEGGGRPAARCFNCQSVTFEVVLNPTGFCPNCGAPLTLPDQVEDYAPTGVPRTVEDIIRAADHDPRLARRGPNLWSIRQGSATIQLAYHEDSGLVTGDAYLCRLPELPDPELFAFLLRQNYDLPQLTFSTFGRDIILSLLIYDRYLTVEAALPRFEHLFRQADRFDNVLVTKYGGEWV